MTTDAPDRPPLPELPPEIAAAVARTVTYVNDDESITVIARGDMTLASVDVQIFPGSHAIEVGAQLTSVCSVALEDVQQWTTATLLQSVLVDDEARAMMTGAGPAPESGAVPDPTVVTQGAVTVVVGADMRLQSISVEDLGGPSAIGPDTVAAVNKALLLARGGAGDDLEAMADERIAQLDAELDRIHSTLDGLDERLSAIDRGL
jgi:hypothetical protein